ncbi:MAG: hypothetical protein ACHWZW_12235 [Spirulina sp.]
MTDSTPIAHITVTFNDGTVQTYGLNSQQTTMLQMASRVKTMMESNMVALELEDRLVMLPMYSIRMIEVSPAPNKLPDTVLRQVTPMD